MNGTMAAMIILILAQDQQFLKALVDAIDPVFDRHIISTGMEGKKKEKKKIMY